MTPLGLESERLDKAFAGALSQTARDKIWGSVARILQRGPLGVKPNETTGLALGFVQSGKTTSITALIAAAADQGYRIVICLLGSTNLLLGQNTGRIDAALGISTRRDYRWVTEASPSGVRKSRAISTLLANGRTIFIPILKHAGRIDRLTEVLRQVDVSEIPTLIVDDEADQASLNVSPTSLSRTYEAITNLREVLPQNLYMQYTATPYAPLLLDLSDHLLPQFVEFLEPGEGYTGGKEFFVDHALAVVRDVPALEEQATQAPSELPRTLEQALANFVVGTALLLANDASAAPVSMLVHSTHRNDIQARYHHLIERQLREWHTAAASASSLADLPSDFSKERDRLISAGATDSAGDTHLTHLNFVLREAKCWLVNSTEAVNSVTWNISPVHILVGGNKLDRGFTVEGLTVTYMNRRSSNQIDTMEQRARAFGYRGDLLPYCQFFASRRTVRMLTDVVFAEQDLRTSLRDFMEEGRSVPEWAEEVGLLLPPDSSPTRANVTRQLAAVPSGWKSLRTPFFDDVSVVHNQNLVTALGVLDGVERHFGRRSFKATDISKETLYNLIAEWAAPPLGADWRTEQILESISRYPHAEQPVTVLLMEEPEGVPRVRYWDEQIGFVNLFQGRDNASPDPSTEYPGDRQIPNIKKQPDQLVLQIHRVRRREPQETDPPEIFTLAVYLGDRRIVRAVQA